jgi:hypothetical protein
METGMSEISSYPVAAEAAYPAKYLTSLALQLSTITTTTIILLEDILSIKR